ncbi:MULTISPECIES: hypothetical protein [Bacillus cereus group]|uniref:Uncharacterized protein n=1 Tax=Bacillus thuringiensis serovar andalousiensis TaxID=257985 RepID=A0A6H0TH81_BACTU|nr:MULTISPECIES: hypothetical protein [Bacillus cereus group]MED1404290.1 hypothetical protein [Bacillus mycoides]QIW19044.1 hypothetical protein EVG22_11410 [Bacillus thuringiensis serovar andalousiensis]
MTDQEGEKDMKAGVKPIQPMNIEFDTQAQVQKFINWASGQGEKTKTTENVRNKFAAYIQKKNRG